MLGILIDAGRHYFHVWWLKRLIDVLAVLQFNIIHFRLTDDQAFAIQLASQPNLTWPVRFQGQKKRVISHPSIRKILTDVIREVLDIFENRPHYRFGGDEMEIAQVCFDEVGAQLFDHEFEGMLQSTFRWRETIFAHPCAPHPMRTKTKRRAGKINHCQHDTPAECDRWNTYYWISMIRHGCQFQ